MTGDRARRTLLKGLRWAAPGILAVEAALVWAGWLSVRAAVIVALAVEILLAGVLVVVVLYGAQAFRRARSNGSPTGAAALVALADVLPPPIVSLARHEIGIFVALYRALLRRPDVPEGAHAISYGREQFPMFVVLGFVAAAEIAMVEVLVPLPWLRLVLLILGVYGAVWIAGFYLSMRVRPHILTREALVLRAAHLELVSIPLAEVDSVTRELRSISGRSVSVSDGCLRVTMSGTATIRIDLERPIDLVVARDTCAVSSVRLTSDAPHESVVMIREAVLSSR